MAPAGGIALSDSVFTVLDGTLRPSFADQGEQELKNIERPVRVWMRAPAGAALASPGIKPTDFPSLVVNAVVTANDRSEVQDLAGGLTADIALYLDSVQWIDTGEGYELTQTLRARGDRLRLDARLTSPESAPIWSGKYDGDLADSFDWQDQISEAVAGEVLGVILQSEGAKITHLDEGEMSAEQLMFKGKISFVDQSESASPTRSITSRWRSRRTPPFHTPISTPLCTRWAHKR